MAALEQLRTQTDSAGDSAIGRTATICRADDLKGFLLQLSDQIADADRRHSAALRDMHERLSRLGDQTGSLKATLPKEFSADLERLEAGMASLVQRIVESDQARPAPPAEHIEAATAAHAVADSPKHAGEAAVSAVAADGPKTDRNAVFASRGALRGTSWDT